VLLSNSRIALSFARWNNANTGTGRLREDKRHPGAYEPTGFFAATGPLVTLSPRPFSENTEPSSQSSPEKDLGHPRSPNRTVLLWCLQSAVERAAAVGPLREQRAIQEHFAERDPASRHEKRSAMKVSQCIGCAGFPCADVQSKCYVIPDIDVKPKKISIVMISEAAPASPSDYYYAGGDSLFQRTTVEAFNDAGAKVASIRDVVALGVYLTTAVKCGKTGYGIKASTTKECSLLLERELALFPNTKVLMLMGDVAIKALNYIAQRVGEARVIPAISTYKLRGQEFHFQGKRVFPSYLQAGPSFFIEKSKRKMIAEDISAALQLVR